MATEIWFNIGSGNGNKAFTWTNVDLSSVRSSGIRLRAILQDISQPPVTVISLKIASQKFCSNLPGANELRLHLIALYRKIACFRCLRAREKETLIMPWFQLRLAMNSNDKISIPNPDEFFRVNNSIISRWWDGADNKSTSWKIRTGYSHDDVIKWKHFLRHWPFVRGIHRYPVNSPHKGQWHGALMFFFNGWVNNREAGDLRRNRAHYDVILTLDG